jgi:hypothetical protein
LCRREERHDDLFVGTGLTLESLADLHDREGVAEDRAKFDYAQSSATTAAAARHAEVVAIIDIAELSDVLASSRTPLVDRLSPTTCAVLLYYSYSSWRRRNASIAVITQCRPTPSAFVHSAAYGDIVAATLMADITVSA